MSWKALITDAGNELSAKTISGGSIKLTHAKAGSGTVSEQDLHLQTELVNVKQTLSIESIKYSNAVNNIEILLDCRGLKEAYDLTQIGIYATDPDAGEILFAIAQTENPKHIPAENEVPFYSIDFNFAFALKNNQNMVATIDQSTFATKEQLSAVDARIDNIIVNAGSTEDNAELIDMRVGVDGKRHSTAGEALRSQLKQKANLTDISSPYQFRGACLSANLPGSGNKINDTYYVTDKKCKFTWNGAAWYQSSLNESDYEEELSSLTENIGNQEDKLEPIVKSKQDLKDAFYIVDIYGNIICKVDKDGVHASGFDGKNLALNDVISTYEDSFYISDSNGNVIFKADKDGVRGLNMGASSGIDSPFKGMKLLTIGDSLSAHNNWQKWLVEWLGVTFDNDENINGKDGHKPMAKGGTAIAPTAEDSIYMRSLDAKYYADDTNGTVIIIYAGQNDSVALGTIDDTPYTDKTVTASSNLTFYSSYMGMIENILADIPFARIYLMTQMPVRLEIGMTGTVDPYIGVIRFPDMTSVLAYEASRYKKVEAIRAISRKYSLPCIDLWEDSGINDYNSKYWYGAVGGTCGQVHPNNIGYKRMAEVAVAKMY